MRRYEIKKKQIKMIIEGCCACPYCNIPDRLCEHGDFRFDDEEILQIEEQEIFIPERCGLFDYEP